MLIKKRYFVVLNTDMEGVYCPLMLDPDWEVMKLFETEFEALCAGNNDALGKKFGFEIFEIGGGIDFSDGIKDEEK